MYHLSPSQIRELQMELKGNGPRLNFVLNFSLTDEISTHRTFAKGKKNPQQNK